MEKRCRCVTKECTSSELDQELSEVLLAISAVTRRIANRLLVTISNEEMKGGPCNGKRIIQARS